MLNDPGLDVPPDLLAVDPEEMRRLGYWVVDRTIEHLTTLDEPAAHPRVRCGTAAPRPSAARRRAAGTTSTPTSRPRRRRAGATSSTATTLGTSREWPRPPRSRASSPTGSARACSPWRRRGAAARARPPSNSSPWSGCATPSAWPHPARACCCPAARWPTSPASSPPVTRRGEGVVYLVRPDPLLDRPRRCAPSASLRPRPRRSPTGGDFRMSPADLAAPIEADLAAGRRPPIVVATAGTTNTGAVDDLPGPQRRLPRATACGCTSTARTADRRHSALAAARPCRASTSPTRSSPIRTSGCSSRTTWPACSSASQARSSARSRCTRSTSPTSTAAMWTCTTGASSCPDAAGR